MMSWLSLCDSNGDYLGTHPYIVMIHVCWFVWLWLKYTVIALTCSFGYWYLFLSISKLIVLSSLYLMLYYMLTIDDSCLFPPCPLSFLLSSDWQANLICFWMEKFLQRGFIKCSFKTFLFTKGKKVGKFFYLSRWFLSFIYVSPLF